MRQQNSEPLACAATGVAMKGLGVLAVAMSLAALPGQLVGQGSAGIALGLGAGSGGVGGGLAVRTAIAIDVEQFGVVLRSAGHTGPSTCDPCLFGIPNPEVVREFALLGTRGVAGTFPEPVRIGLGVGRVSGDRDDPQNASELIPIPVAWGAAFEAVWELGDRSGFGGGFAVEGNLNGEASFLEVVLFGSLGFLWGAG